MRLRLGLLAIAVVAMVGTVSAEAGLASQAATPTTAARVLTAT